ncbi:MAG: hypothetical protein RBQ64_02370 [Candidatus Izemoplasmatales bacterium]|jgi:hypothetical protein|nr:hypothetical protein [Candidatus Izemoplasmatales bacterium]
MGKLGKRLIKTVVILLIIVFIIIGLPLILLSKKTTAPIDQYNTSSESALYSMLDEELSDLITDINDDTVFLTIDEAFINRTIQKELSKDNPKFLNSQYEGEMAYSYMMVFNNFGVKGIWTELSDDQIKITAGADYVSSSGNVLYQTGIEMVFDIVLSENEEYYLKISDIKIGKINIGVNTAYKLANFIVDKITDQSLNDLIAQNLAFGAFNEEDLSFTVGEEELTNYLYEEDPTFAALLKVVYEQELLILDISDEGFDVSLNVGIFRRLSTDLDEPDFDKWENDMDKAAFMASLAAQAATNAFLNPTDPRIDLDEVDVNQILDYYLQEKVKFELPIKFTLDGDEIEFVFSSTNLFVTMVDDKLSIHLLMTLSKTGMTGTFDMQFNLSSTVSMNSNGDMVLSIIEANLGEVELTNDMLATLFGIFDPNLMVDDTLIVKKETLNSMFEGSGIVFDDSYVINGELRLHFGLDD